MKKKSLYILIIMLIVVSCTLNVYADENEQNLEAETNVAQAVEKKNEIIVVKAKVKEVGNVEDVVTGSITNKIQKVKVKILEGEYKGETIDTTYNLSYDMDNKILAYELSKGNTVFLQITTNPNGEVSTQVQDIVRQNYLVAMIFVFFIIIIVVGRKQGLKAIVSLDVTILAIFYIMVNGIYKGYSPILMSIITSGIIIVVTFFILGGVHKKVITAGIGTLGGVLSAGLMAFIFGYIAKLSGGQEEAIMLSINTKNLVFNFKELLFAGIVIASLGATMDVGMSIASSLDELKSKNREMSWKELFKSGMNIGGDMIGTMTNTLILAYVGGALTTILLFLACDMSLTDIINREAIVTDAVSAIAGSMGVVFTVPITAITYAIMNKDKTYYKSKSDNKIDGKRSLKL